MNKFLTTLDTFTTASLPYALTLTFALIATKLLGCVISYNTCYNWLAALSPILVGILAVGVVNFFSFCLDQE